MKNSTTSKEADDIPYKKFKDLVGELIQTGQENAEKLRSHYQAKKQLEKEHANWAKTFELP